jgi:hypothetical protein
MEIKMDHMYVFNVGDWSKDGHNQCEQIVIKANKTKKEIMESYLKSVRELGIALHHGYDKTSFAKLCPSVKKEEKMRSLAVEYEDSRIDPEVVKILKDAGCEIEKFSDESWEDGKVMEDGTRHLVGTDGMVGLFFWFVSRNLKKFTWEAVKFENLNGFWDKDYNISFGYGLFH